MRLKWIFAVVLLGGSAVLGQLDRTKYIGIDEIKPGMPAYCLTVYQGTKIEKFEMEVLSVIKNSNPGIFDSGGRNVIMVMGLDERFKHTGPVQGCSGSPVYIDGRMAGALAVGFGLSKDPLYGVTPIEEMLQASEIKGGQSVSYLNIDRSKPFSIEAAVNAYKDLMRAEFAASQSNMLEIPLVSSIGQSGQEFLNEFSGGAKFRMLSAGQAGSLENLDVKLEPGSTLVVPIVSGDIAMSALGTVTEVDGDKVYGFGHPFMGQGALNLPMANGYVHTVASNLSSSFKIGQAGKIVGALKNDESTAVFGVIGQQAPLIPLTINVNTYNDSPKQYKCQLAVHEKLTPLIANIAMIGAVGMKSELPMEHTIKYRCDIGINGFDDIIYENYLTGQGIVPVAYEWLGILATLMNNPYQKVNINSIEFSIDIEKQNGLMAIDDVYLSDVKVKPGENVNIEVITEKYLGGKSSNKFELKIPDNIKDGKYQISISGRKDYQNFVMKKMPHKFMEDDMQSLLSVIRKSVSIANNRLYLVMELPDDGVSLELAELPSLPSSKMMVLSSDKRTVRMAGLGKWIEESIETDGVVMNDVNIEISVEK